jgi:hypothetical protein
VKESCPLSELNLLLHKHKRPKLNRIVSEIKRGFLKIAGEKAHFPTNLLQGRKLLSKELVQSLECMFDNRFAL